jgi:diguanylate cyclase (GGDEF)-like protein
MIDIDHFKQFNDRHGHLVGDEVLRSVFRVLASVVRDRDVLARYGGEEFCIVLPGIELSVAAQVAERLRERVENTAGQSLRDPRELQVTTSLGVAALRPNLDSADGLIERADAALYEAKRSGRNRVCVSSDTPAT